MALFGSTERRIAALRVAASMNRRLSKEDPIMSAKDLIAYAEKLSEFAYRGEDRKSGDSL